MKRDDPTDPVVQPERSALLPHHAELIRASGISDAVRDSRGYSSATAASELVKLGFFPRQAIVPALLIPIFGIAGDVVGYQARPDRPRIGKNGKPVKYETPQGATNVIDVPARVFDVLGDPKVPLWITEGARKADAMVSAGATAVSISGVYGWRGRNEHGGLVALPDWEAVALKGRDVRIGFDSDIRVKPKVARAAARLGAFLSGRGAHVRYLVLSDDR